MSDSRLCFHFLVLFSFVGGVGFLHFYKPDTQRIFVDIGLGFHVEFTWSEALNFISQREERLARYTLFLL